MVLAWLQIFKRCKEKGVKAQSDFWIMVLNSIFVVCSVILVSLCQWLSLYGIMKITERHFCAVHLNICLNSLRVFLPHTTSIHTPNLICHAQVKFNKIMIYNVYICIQYMYTIYVYNIYTMYIYGTFMVHCTATELGLKSSQYGTNLLL